MSDPAQKVLTKTAYEHLVAAVRQMMEEGKKVGQQADRRDSREGKFQ